MHKTTFIGDKMKMRKKRFLAKKRRSSRRSTPLVHGGAGSVMAIIQYSRNRGKPWGGHPLVTMVTSAIRGKGLFCWKWSRHQERALEDLALLLEIFKKTIRQWFKTLLKIGLRGKPSDFDGQTTFFIIDEVGFCKIEVEGQATQGKQHPRNLIWC